MTGKMISIVLCLERQFPKISKMPPRLRLTDDQIERMKKEFLLLDVDGDGTITIQELAGVLRSMKTKLEVSEADIERTLKDIDQDGDGTIDIEEYVKSRKNKTNRDLLHRALSQRARIRRQFHRYDRDKSGYVTKDELIAVIQATSGVTVTLEQTEKIIQNNDQDDDGKIDYEEFVLLMIN